MKKLLIIFAYLLIFTNCRISIEPDIPDIYKWTIDVTYLNGEQETINCQFKSINDCEIKYIVDEQPCIIVSSFSEYEIIACGVRKFSIVSKEIILAKEKYPK